VSVILALAMVKRCFFNITIGGEDQGRIIFELWDEVGFTAL
jgi:hypothetical protein